MGTGFIKCIPITFSGFCVCEAIFVIDIEEVLEAKIVLTGQILSKVENMLDLINFVKLRVKEKTGINLELELEIVN